MIANAGGYGIYAYGCSNLVIQGNYIGTDASGQKAFGCTYDGISLDLDNKVLVGGTNSGEGNVIDANGYSGMTIGRYGASTNVAIYGNTIGFAASVSITNKLVRSHLLGGGTPGKSPRLGGALPNHDSPIDLVMIDANCPYTSIIGATPSTGLIGQNFLYAGNGSCVNVLSGNCELGANTYSCPIGSAPCTVSPGANNNQPAPTVSGVTYSGSILSGTVSGNGPASTSLTGESYWVSPANGNNEYDPIGSNPFFDITTDGGGTFTWSLHQSDPAPPAGVTGVAVAITDPCGSSPLSTPASASTAQPPPPPPGTTVANNVESGNSGCPVSTMTGELYETPPPDITLGGPLPLVFQRYYAASLKRDGFITGRLGDNWLHNYEQLLITVSSNVVEVITEFGRVIQFTNTAGGYVLMGRQDIPYQLIGSGANYILGNPHTQRLHTFNSSGQLTQIADGRGNTQTLSYSGNLLTTVADGLGQSLTFQYDASGFLTNITDGSRSVGFIQSGTLLTQSIDPLGNGTTYTYDATNAVSGLLTMATQPEGNTPYTQTFNSSGQVVVQVEAGLQPGTNTFSYIGTTNATMTDPLGYQSQDIHTSAGQLARSGNQAGLSVVMGYNAAGQRTAVTDRLGRTVLMSYHPASGKMASLTNADGTVTTFAYTSHTTAGLTFYDLAQMTFPDGTSESFTYDAWGNALIRTDRAGQVWHFSYNGRGQLLTAQNPAGGLITLTYNSDGTLASRQDSDTGTTTFLYDQFRRLTNTVNPDATSIKMAYDAAGRLTRVTDELGHSFAYAYDRNGSLRTMTDPSGAVAGFGYDPRNRLLQSTNRLGAVTTLIYDARGLLVTNLSPTADITAFTYDARRRPASQMDPAGNVWLSGYDNEDLVATTANPLGQTAAVNRNTMGSVTNATDPLNNTVSFTRDTLQRTTLTLDALARSNNFAYDARGEVVSAGRSGIGSAIYQRNALGLLSSLTDLNSNNWTLNYTTMGRLLAITDPLNRITSHTYDSRGRLLRTVFADNSTCTNSYDAVGNPVGSQYSAGPKLQYTYDALNRLVAADNIALSYDAESRTTNTVSSGVNFGATYDLSGRLTGATYYNGAFAVHYAYDRRGLLTNVSDTLTGANVSFAYDVAGQLTGVTRANGVNGSYHYDANGRLTHYQDGGSIDLQLTYDAAGQITTNTMTVPLDAAGLLAPTQANLHYDAAQQITGAGYAYDVRGRQIAAPGHSYGWDGATRLQTVDGVTLGYNGLNQLLTRTQGGVTRRYFYNRAIARSPILAERNETSSQMERYYVWTPGGQLLYLIDATKGNAVSYYHFDPIGSTLALTAANGSISDAYAYSPYGVLLGHTGTNSQPFTYIGEYGVRSESAAGLYDMRARYYDPVSARFLSVDPLWPRLSQPESLNPYEYALRNPASYNDPLGLCAGAINAVAGGVMAVGNSVQAGADLANGQALQLCESASNILFDWHEGFLHGAIAAEDESMTVLEFCEATDEAGAAARVNFQFSVAPHNPFAPNLAGEKLFINSNVEMQARRYWWQNTQSEVAQLEEKGSQIAGKASKLKALGTGLAVVGAAVQTGAAVYQDYKNGAGVVITATDAGATVVANVAIVAAPPVAAADFVTGGAISGGIHNAAITPNTVARVALGRVTTGDADAIKVTYTRFAVGRWAWFAGEYYYALVTGNPLPQK